ncbi:MAG: bifunctional oligoribonuclease/PAP phosphatase NrnA [Saprospiraceae bacterium]
MEKKLVEVKKLLAQPKKIVITSHRNPDGDAMGSSLGLQLFLDQFGHDTTVVLPSDYPEFVAWMKGSERILIHDDTPQAADEKLKAADIIFVLDYNGLDRVDKMGEVIGTLTDTTKIMIDHHLYPDDFCDFTFSDTNASSTCEMIYDFITGLEEQEKLTIPLGECLYSGILTDTGSFKYSTSSKLFRVVAGLKDMGVDDTKLQNLLFNSLPEKNLRLLGYCLNNCMEILPEYKTGIISLTKEDYEHFDIQRGDTEGIVNYLLMMKQIKLAAFITEQPTIVKISLRSKGDFSVQEIAKKHFRGGGHKNASGGASFKGLRSTINKFKRVLPDYKEALNQL